MQNNSSKKFAIGTAICAVLTVIIFKMSKKPPSPLPVPKPLPPQTAEIQAASPEPPSDPLLKHDSNLNIANTFYDMGKLQEALPYYQLALDEYSSEQQDPTLVTEMIRFIEERIAEINSKLSQ